MRHQDAVYCADGTVDLYLGVTVNHQNLRAAMKLDSGGVDALIQWLTDVRSQMVEKKNASGQ